MIVQHITLHTLFAIYGAVTIFAQLCEPSFLNRTKICDMKCFGGLRDNLVNVYGGTSNQHGCTQHPLYCIYMC